MCTVDAVHELVTDDQGDPAQLEALRGHGLRVTTLE
jgi:hypothetical protein